MRKYLPILFFILCGICAKAQLIKPGADRPELYMPTVKDGKIGIVVNQTSCVGDIHLLDFLIKEHVKVEKIFCPEHGFRGDADAGEKISDGVDADTGVPVISLYGSNRKPTANQMKGLDAVIFDLQDVGVRFYTYLSTMYYVMEACAENDVQLIVLDRPNPNGDYVAGPVLKPAFTSFVGIVPVPVVHGCTLGELAMMINGEGWLKNKVRCRLTVIPVDNYSHNTRYSLPVRPSPNLPNDVSVRLYPSLCFFEATNVSIGRGTMFPFQVIGYPDASMGDFMFVPESIEGMAKNPIQMGKICYGEDLRNSSLSHKFTLSYFLEYYGRFAKESDFLSSERWFNLLSGTDEVLKSIRMGKPLEDIEASWQDELDAYLVMRRNYLLYPEK